MGYLHIDNLYKDQTPLMFNELYALEKIHGTSAHVRGQQILIGTDAEGADGCTIKFTFFSGGTKHENFVKLFDQDALTKAFIGLGYDDVTVYGEAYGGKCQGMSDTYGKALKFIVFDVKVGKTWLAVPDMAEVAAGLGFEVVDWVRIPATMLAIDEILYQPSEQAKRNGIVEPKRKEGIVLRPILEMTSSNGKRVIAKHKHPDFCETATKRPVSKARLEEVQAADAIAQEWVTDMRLTHVSDRVAAETQKTPGIEDTGLIIQYMVEDVRREGEREFVDSKQARKAIGHRAAMLWKHRLQAKLYKETK